ncbi:hypothetical protein [Pseudoponticoccus marisrubri]|uniref:Uncharacterized protein n=1 Tax=Pseudoponticoccus marisrubri TaxID=1685382 RepID=A0A0W7WPX3_9RHOB|nr:hypothetical protein [Pseudoponticoccus marisrubri]KUF12635.1 hypothetical protein AVJ23_02645 [Pseudoponticoccus marisrubri]
MLRIGALVGAGVIFFILVVAGADYLLQARAAGQGPLAFGLSGWTESFAERGRRAADRKRMMADRDAPLSTHYPEAPTGWERLDWDPAHEAFLKRDRNRMVSPQDDPYDRFGMDPARDRRDLVAKMIADKAGPARPEDIRVYTDGDTIVVIKTRFLDLRPRRLWGVTALVGGRDFAGGDWAAGRPIRTIHHGVAFRDMRGSGNARGTRIWRAMIGLQMEVTIATNGRAQDMDRILAGVDFRTMKTLVEWPEGVEEQSTRELRAEMARQRLERQRRRASYLEAVESELDRKASIARSRSRFGEYTPEVCVDYRGREYCRWVHD